jgi:chromosome segregation ATPase
MIRELARRKGSDVLAQLAARMDVAVRGGEQGGESTDGVFGKVTTLINDLLERLQQEADAEATHKAYCDKEMSETSQKKDEKDALLQKLTVKIDTMTSQVTQLAEETAATQKELADIAKSQAMMDSIRLEEKANHAESKTTMEEGISGVQRALKVLREYYAKDDKQHSASEGTGSSIIGILEVAESDFSKGLSEMLATEEAAQSVYEEETKQNQITRASKDQDVAYKRKESKALDKSIAELSSDKDGVQPSCRQ